MWIHDLLKRWLIWPGSRRSSVHISLSAASGLFSLVAGSRFREWTQGAVFRLRKGKFWPLFLSPSPNLQTRQVWLKVFLTFTSISGFMSTKYSVGNCIPHPLPWLGRSAPHPSLQSVLKLEKMGWAPNWEGWRKPCLGGCKCLASGFRWERPVTPCLPTSALCALSQSAFLTLPV